MLKTLGDSRAVKIEIFRCIRPICKGSSPDEGNIFFLFSHFFLVLINLRAAFIVLLYSTLYSFNGNA